MRLPYQAQFGTGFCAHQEYRCVHDTGGFDVLGDSLLGPGLQRVDPAPATHRFFNVESAEECVHGVVRGQPRGDRGVPAGMRLGQVEVPSGELRDRRLPVDERDVVDRSSRLQA